MALYLFDDLALGDSFEFPAEFLEMCESGLPDLDPWFWLVEYEDQARFWLSHFNGARSINVLPFAKDGGSDDVACFSVGDHSRVQVLHGFCSPGFAGRGEMSFAEWLEIAEQHRREFLEE